ncbi:hypothetical protein predicted by Glimmer/Critica [Sorangium cellulosum So ce56]|uniref:Uncharacterized protein n=2 Tax=Polyangiaceae TaxID=49 RepID=A9G1C4_SORC5|nr:hypothetical protein predicted by Glimmer/Critica [Sorangium cellulosum So ce56]
MRSVYASAGLCAAMVVACTGETTGETRPGGAHPEDMGFVTVQWSIEDKTDAAQCKARGATAVELVLINTKSNKVTRQVVPCERFDASVQLVADNYVGTLSLVDDDGRPVSDPQAVGPFEVSGDESTTRKVSFPAAERQREPHRRMDRSRR